MSFDNIGFFQFDNLMQSRVPMVLVLLVDAPLKPWYNSMIGMHIDNISLRTTAEAAVAAIQGKNLPPHFAVVVLDSNESQSPAIVHELEKLGYLNAYYVKGGWDALVAERLNQ
jgi:rhodanese-related sulfurtransferase